MRRIIVLVCWLALVAGVTAAQAQQAGGSATKRKAKKKAAVTAEDVQSLRDAIAAQQQQIEQLKQELERRDQAVQQQQQAAQQAQSAAAAAQSKADQAAAQAAQQQQDVTAIKNDVTDLKQNATNTALTLQETQKSVTAMESPLALHYKGITITPGGFLAAETVWRNRGLASDINTPFNSLTLPGSSQNSLPEFFGSGRQSRVAMLAEGKLKGAKLTGYVEADFLSAGATSNNNESNSYTLRQRQVWGQAALNDGWSFTGGQMWSLVTETKKGLDNRTEALPMTIDPQYTVGFSWARQYGFRVVKNFNNKIWWGFSVENSQATSGGHGQNSNFLIGAAGNSGGLYNAFNGNYAFNPAPDFITKLAFEPGWGHFEVYGIVSDFRDRIFPCATAATGVACNGVTGASPAGAYNDSGIGGGIGGNIRVSLFNKHMDLGAHVLGGHGIGRYGTAGLPDVTERPDGVLSMIRSYQGLGTLEFHYPKFDVYFNGGAEYAGRDAFLNGSKGEGYGSPLFSNSGCYTETLPGSGGFSPGSLGSCTGDTRVVIEGTTGFFIKFYNGPKGRIQWGPQYSYVTRNTWSGDGLEPHGIDNMIFTSFRYYLP